MVPAHTFGPCGPSGPCSPCTNCMNMIEIYSDQLFGCCSSKEHIVPCLGQLYSDDPPVLVSHVALFVEVT